MPDVSIFNIDKQDINVKDSTARSAAQAAQQTAPQASQKADTATTTAGQAQSAAEQAQTAAETAQTKAEQAQAQVQEILDLSRLEISYEPGTETITFTTSDHAPTA